LAISDLESTLTGSSVSVDNKGVNGRENMEALRDSEEESPEWEGRMVLFADRGLAEALAARAMARRRRAAGVLVLVDQTAVRRVKIGWARWPAAPLGVARKEWGEYYWRGSERRQVRATEAWSRMKRSG